jgi:hypothetical protein
MHAVLAVSMTDHDVHTLVILEFNHSNSETLKGLGLCDTTGK